MKFVFCGIPVSFSLPSLAFSLILAAGSVGLASAETSTAANTLSESEKRSGWELLFDGNSMAGWRNYNSDEVSDGWKVVEGALVRQSGGAGDLITNEQFDAFELSLQYKISEAGNSGLMFHVVETDGPPWHTGPEVQIQDNVKGHDPQKSGWLYQLFDPQPPRWAKDTTQIDATRPAGEWNELYLRVAPSDCRVCMNGQLYYSFKVGDGRWNDRVAASKFSAFAEFGKAGKGHLCLQDHGDPVAFRNIKVRRLDEDESVSQPIDGQLGLKNTLAFPDLQWDQWEAIDDAGQIRPLRLIELTYAKDDSNRLFAVSQIGAIWTFQNTPDVVESELFLDLRGKVHDWKRPGANEQGLLGLAMHPQYKSNGKFYVYYSHPSESKSILSCFHVSKDDPNRADPNSEQILMQIDQPFQNHNGGSIEFGPDGYLYVGLGDGGYRNDPLQAGQDLSKILGKILRIDVDQASDAKPYGIPLDNPFVNVADAQSEIYAFGLRNPWRIAFDPSTGRLWTGDVGQELWEEIDVIEKGGNYGWSSREGTHPFGNRVVRSEGSDPITPVWEYDHAIGKSVTGGRVYRGQRVPALSGKYLYADYVTGSIWALSYDPQTGKATRNEQVVPDSMPVLAFGQDPSGEVYSLTNSVRGECIYRFDLAE
ncbi:PQQ-dependent sugar dehydrogenase [Novipirellula artificiosorum]|uniref:Soluble aldose sugar dehydrogenase YliI n=1 Tax=Novipirellula artificiosorum TaxID=2528016 RepID=A0A5C6E6T3_9BACT|nr:family 16 glycoside hydrolase [Novipirellula artificiosorum]TWU42899.1 Soluble aldose sugar dehydrogenase YliI precursor [Novipirellula artificiosorum]